ncbi:zinc finger protein 292b [Osmerus eperlanus]|uniref:zinc finger protein 292b n=1 Tax=Osmerus eperlanus TaxID=29151 RepID=UPI002E0D3859
MADEEAEQDRCARSDTSATIVSLRERLQELAVVLKDCADSGEQSSSQYCQQFCQTLVEYAGRWKVEDDPLTLVEVYRVALLSYAEASPCLSTQCENVPLVLERLSLSCVELLLSLPNEIPDTLWKEFQSSVQSSHSQLQENGIPQLSLLSGLVQGTGVWTNSTLHSLLSHGSPHTDQVHEFLALEGPQLLLMRMKHLFKEKQEEKALHLAKACTEYPEFEGKGHFKQMHLICLCAVSEQEQLMEELSKVDCRDSLEMICNLESEGNDRGAFSLCTAFLTRQLLHGDSYCAWELTLFWSKLLKRLEASEQTFLDRCRQMSLLSKTVYHILFLIKVIQSEMATVGLPVCIEMCIRALQMESSDGSTKATICKTISCLLPTDLEVKRACQLTEFLLEPTVDSYYAVETLYNEPDQKLEEDNLPVPNSLRCELLLVFKTQWPFDPEFWDWKALKRQCLALMGEEASIVSSIDLLNDSESPEAPEEEEDGSKGPEDFRDVTDCFVDTTNELKEITDKRQKNREVKKLREKGFISARFRNWQAYMQYCVLCDKEFLGHRIVRHAQTHYKDGVYSCPICAETFTSKETLVPHVASHVKLSSKERLAAMKTSKKLSNPKTAAPVIAALKAKTENQLWTKKENSDSQETNGEFPETVQAKVSDFKMECSDENTCPVANCRKGFKFLKNLLAHVKAHGDNDEAKRFLEMQNRKVICQYCRRQFVNVTHLNDHLQVHCGVRPYICIQLNCRASFLSNTELLVHRKEHVMFKARCMFPSCGKIFSEAYKLYDHEAQHYKTFTCNIPDCGKVFHCQTQLDSHQEEHDTKEEECPDQDLQSPPSPNPPHSLVERMLSDQATLSEEICKGNLINSGNETPLQTPDNVRMNHSIEDVFSQGLVQNPEQYTVKSEPPDIGQYPSQQVPCSKNSVIRSTHILDPNQNVHLDNSGASTFDCMRPTPQYPQVPSYQGTNQNMQHGLCTNVQQGQAFPQDGHGCPSKYNSDLGVSLQGRHQGMLVNNLLASGPTPHYTQSAMTQTHLPAVAPLPPTESTMAQFPCSGSLAPTSVEKQRHECALETCTRNYSSYRSVTKHMKAVHPEFYAQWKLSKQINKVSNAASLSIPFVGNPVAALQTHQVNGDPVPVFQRQNVIQSHPHLSMTPNSNHPTSSVQNQALLNQMENILDPIVLSQLENTTNQFAPMQSNVGTTLSWHPTSGNNQNPNSCPSHEYPSKQQGMHVPQMDAISGTHNHGRPSCPMLGTMDNALQPTASYVESLKGSSQLECSTSLYASQTQIKSSTNFIAPEIKTEILNHIEAKLVPAAKDSTISLGHNTEILKSVKKNKRTKWPAIIKDGKYICSRCFREFLSPKSLGGHLSKRSHCKPFDETDLTADLPTSFLDLLNSEQSINAAQPPPAVQYNPSGLYQDKPSLPVTRTLADSKSLSNISYLPANLSTYGVGDEPNDEILKHLMDNTNIPDLFDNLAVPQQPLQNPRGPHGSTDRGPKISVIHHTANVKKTENESYRDPFLQSCDGMFGITDFSDPLLSQILSEKPSSGSPGSLPSDQINNLLKVETITKMRETKRISDDDSGGQTNDGLLAAMASLAQNLMSNPMTQIMSPDPQNSPATGLKPPETQRKNIEQDVKRKLREQILAGDFQRRNSSINLTSTDTNDCSKNRLSLNPATSATHYSGEHQSQQPTKKIEVTTVGQVHDINKKTNPVYPGQIHGPPNPQSFTNFREPSTEHQETPVPTTILANDVDLGPSQSSTDQQHWMMDIQTALERLDLDRELSVKPQSCFPQKTITNDMSHENESNVSKEKVTQVSVTQVSDGFVKPFACEKDNCTYRAMTKDAVLKHLIKTHNYTDEMIHSMKKNHEKFAPFSCQMCSKTFTRNSNLRAHYQTAHRLSPEEVSKLNPKRNTGGFMNNQDQTNVSSAPSPCIQTLSAANGHRPVTETMTRQYSLQDATKQENLSHTFVQSLPTGISDQRYDNTHSIGMQSVQSLSRHNQQLTSSPTMSRYQMDAQSAVMTPQPLPTGPESDRWSNRQYVPSSTVPNQYLPSNQTGVSLPEMTTSVSVTTSDALQTCIPLPVDKHKVNKQKILKPKVDTPKKMKEKKPDANDAFSPYRPYRCVHQGCVAAFTIQHNLILHYRAVHQSALLAFEVNNENDQNEGQDETNNPEMSSSSLEEPEIEVTQVTELRCQIRDCSRVFQDVPSLLQHYLQLHKFSLDKAGSLMSSINLGRFRCDQQGCAATFTAFWKYVGHVKEEHERGALSKVEPVDGMYKCDVDGCDRAYATRSNLLRHTMKKHNDIYKLQLVNQQKSEERLKMSKSVDGKENIESNKKSHQKGCDRKKSDKSKNNHWTKYGNPSLKTKEEASALCIKRYTLQYPCMIKGCDSVMNSERSIMKHYMGHGLSERYLEEQRSHFIFCKKSPRQRYRSVRSDDSKSENSSEVSESDDTADTGQEGSEFEYSKPVLRKRGTTEEPGLFDSKPLNDDSSEAASDGPVAIRRKRGRPQKLHLDKLVKRKRVSRSTRSRAVYGGDKGSDSSSSNALTQDDLNSFKPMGFEMSFLKFLEQSNQSEHSLKRKIHPKATVLCKKSSAYLQSKDSSVDFRNPQQLTSLDKVKIIVDGAYSDVAEILLKQLQEMRPTVILEK